MTTETVTDRPAQASSDLHASIDQVQGHLVEFDKISAGLAAIEKAHPKDVACAVSTPAGMKQAIAGRAAWRDPRVALEKVRKAAKAPVLALGRDIDAFARSLETKLLEGETHYDDQIKAEEARKEAERQARLRKEQERIDAIRAVILDNFISVPAQVADATAAQISAEIQRVVALEIDASYQEMATEAEIAKGRALEALRKLQDKAATRELEAARLAAELEELARQRKEREAEEDRLRKERAALAAQRAAAEEEHQREMLEARARRQREEDEIRAKREEQDRADRARRDEEDRQARLARAAEDERIARERAALQEERRQEEFRQAEARRVEQQRLDAEAAARRQAEEEQIAAQRRADEEERARERAQIEEERARQEAVFQAAPEMLELLRQWKTAEESGVKPLLKKAGAARDQLLARFE